MREPRDDRERRPTNPGRRGVLRAAAVLAAAPLVGALAARADAATTSRQAEEPRLRLTVGSRSIAATLLDSETSRDFASLLPLTLTMKDLFGREKYGPLPRPLSAGGTRAHTYEVGQIVYWAPGPDVAVYYRQDHQRIPEPGIVILGTVDGGVEALALPGSTKLTIEFAR